MLLAALLTLLSQAAGQDPVSLRSTLDALRTGRPGEPQFERALPGLPALLASEASAFVEGAAWLAGQHGRTECVAALITALAREDRRPPERSPATKRAILDALIRLDARVQSEVLAARLDPSLLTETYLLLERDPEHASVALLALFDAAASPRDAEARWAAACALVQWRQPRIAERLLAGMPWSLDVVVHDPGADAPGMGGGGGGAWGSPHDVWPPRPFYTLTLPARDEPLLPVRYTRREATRSISLAGLMGESAQFDLRVRLLDQLLGTTEERGLLASSGSFSLEFSDAAGYEAALRSRLADVLSRITRVTHRLAQSGLVADPESLLAAVTLRVTLHDYRAERDPSLPQPELPHVEYAR